MRHVCFFAPVLDRRALELHEYYTQDIDILRSLGFTVTIATRWCDIPWNAECYFVWWWTWAFLPLLKAQVRHKPVVITGVFNYHSPLPGRDYHGRPWWQRLLLRYALYHASANIFVSQMEYEAMTRELGVHNAHYIPLTTEPHLYTPGESQPQELVLTIAGMRKVSAERKCVSEVIRAIPLVLQKHPTIRFVVAGEQGTSYPDLWALTQKLGVEHAVEFPGIISQERKIALMQRCLVYLQPSIYEGFGLAILEAMSCGAVVVSSPVGAVPEVVGDTGVLVDGRSPEMIAAAVNQLLDDAIRRHELGQHARQRAKTLFARKRRKEALESIVNALLEGN